MYCNEPGLLILQLLASEPDYVAESCRKERGQYDKFMSYWFSLLAYMGNSFCRYDLAEMIVFLY